MPDPIRIIRCDTDAEIAATAPVMRQLRPHIAEEAYPGEVRKTLQSGGILLAAVRGERCVGCALYRIEHRLHTGRMAYVDDLVTDAAERSAGVGKALLGHVAEAARAAGASTLVLDSGVQRAAAHKFYFREGFSITGFNFKREL